MGGESLIVLDTHVLVWLDKGEPRLGGETRRELDKALASGELTVSAISFWETAMLVAKGRLSLPTPVEAWRRQLLDAGLLELPVDGEIGVLAVSLPDLPGDPADRIIVATATRSGATLVTVDERLLAWPGPLPRLDAET